MSFKRQGPGPRRVVPAFAVPALKTAAIVLFAAGCFMAFCLAVAAIVILGGTFPPP